MKKPEWTTACPDWGERIKAGRSIIPPPIFPEQAEAALRIFKELRIVDAPGSPTFGESCAPWVFDFVASVFGACDPNSGRRLITEWFVLIPKKSSKSTTAAGIMLTALILNWRRSAEFGILAPTIEVSQNAFAPARDMCAERTDPELAALMHVQTHVKTITNRDSNATLKVVAADANTVGGKKWVGTLVDELHLMGKNPHAENMLREALGGLASRPEGFVIYTTTQSDEPPAGVFKQKLQYARDVRDGKIHDPQFVPIIFEHPDDMVERKEHLLLENMAMVNPNLGYSVDRQFLEREFRKAQEAGEQSFIGFMAKHANVEVGMNLRSDRWVGADHWESNGDKTLTLESLIRRSEVITCGIDGGGLDDLLGLVFLGRETGTGNWLQWSKAWAHKIVLQRRKDIAPRLLDFEKAGELSVVENPGEDLAELAALVKVVEDAGLLERVGVDTAGIAPVVDALRDEEEGPGIDIERIVGISQGWKMVGAIKTSERRLAQGTMIHNASTLMAWSVGNAKVTPSGNAVIITKQASGSAKIDPLMAALNAVTLMALNPKPMKKQYQMFVLGAGR